MTLTPTPGQTVGPFFHYALPYPNDNELVPPGHPGRIRLHGTVFDGSGAPIPDALLEVRQADTAGAIPYVEGALRRDGFTFTGFGRAATDGNGHYSFSTVRPGAVGQGAVPFFSMCVFARGLLDRLLTRAYLSDTDEGALDGDALLRSLDPARRATLVAVADDTGYQFDIHLQGQFETVFLQHRSR
ncbi:MULTISPECIES: protocatechuate 3,4-dioxygenase subunit alpha [unclassified Mycolicibacterium]|uniref:protocatechuate 3,4-dioxygenase subunit alpha n=1 Tax=unclassified Mycolicibacterium TaxID=2636767 RepID=UPI0012DBE1B8|nr:MULTISPECIES: protocatechuate 3,4-dioxygenase subunit alpha [unclassified Mycolicibacterium]MUL83010.1 protocatechuate 3,4-dioxygenase subunit alpha [Mycolicibacterium sp. CBMA 329]MUL89345.1 protocatechuate 3,4-dioxygenase subunit alpha [Mycolicibacterium sp. CBMA 331]MUL99034.1 protocatechuate 3,4-dioxygenase subunit alpha [Mycolicibacterium sp. CBMA 334]MUM38861.1 protocatechuate 3,4-dioxygenase subunit alpha [Mycolicibacterium sp. CBMA 247]MUM45409.1 protocatechuate 3,4-dioxygenase subu